MTKTNFGLTLKNKVLLGCGDFPYTTDNTGKRISAFTAYLKASNVSKTAHISTVNLSHRPTGEVIVKSDVKVQPPMADMLQPQIEGGQHVNNVNICQHPHSVVMPFTSITIPETIKHLQMLPQIEDMLKEVKPYRFGKDQNQTLSFLNITQCVKLKLNSLLRKYRSTSRARSCIETHLKDKKVIAKGRSNNYANHALSKISKLVLTDYYQLAYTVRLMGFFCMRNFSMRPHIYGGAVGGTLSSVPVFCITGRSTPLQFCHPHLTVNGRTPLKNTGVHTHV